MLSAEFKPCERRKSSSGRTVSPSPVRRAAGAQSGHPDQLSRPRTGGQADRRPSEGQRGGLRVHKSQPRRAAAAE